MNVYPRRPLFHRKSQSNIYRMFLWVMLILGGVWMIQQINRGEIKPLFEPTPTPTRSVDSYLLEGDANFTAGNVGGAITAYQEALRENPNDAITWAKLARIQAYSSEFLIVNLQKKDRLTDALKSADKAVELAPENSFVRAVRAFVLDWNANTTLYADDPQQVQKFLIQAEQEALTALQLDTNNTLALAYYAEISLDQQKWDQAQQYIDQALAHEDADQWMDVHRINAYLLETLGDYNLAITEYDKAIAIEPNFTFLHRRAGANYRTLAFAIANREGVAAAEPTYKKSLEYFERAARINEQIGVKDPGPYLSIARTYSQLGEFFIAARNAQKALEFDPNNADIYGQLGVIYFRSRNYEGSIFSFECAIRGCSGDRSCQGRGLEKCNPDLGPEFEEHTIEGLPIAPNTIVYYYTYGSVLAALSRPRDNKCGAAMEVFGEVRAELDAHPDAYADGRDTILSIVDAGESICASLTENGLPPNAPPEEATSTPEAGEVEAPDVTATPTP
jgi:tetratricopeptide (TPR) repeat protein